MIEVRNINKFFEDTQILFDISTVFEPGKINMTIGRSGSGKTVLLKCIIGLLSPDTGHVFYDDKDFFNLNYKEQKKLRHQIGMLFQGSALFNSMTVEDNVAFALRMFTDWSKSKILDRVNFCLERVNLENANKLFPSELSGGMQKRVGIARAISMNPKYLFYDEPNSGLDPKTSRLIDTLIKEITVEYQTTTIINSHDMASVYDISDKIVFIHEGQKWWEGHAGEIKTSGNNELLQMMDASGHA
jgi:phospholipid/cholesterol/gamma-HCH transport system ATP-binding protein